MADLTGKTIVPATLAGRATDGMERGKGAVIHAVAASTNELRFGINSYALSLCGKTHGARSAGWSLRRGAEFNCPRCMKIFAEAGNKA